MNLLISAAAGQQIDFYAFTVPTGGATVTIEIVEGSTAIELLLCDTQGNLIANGASNGFGFGSRIARFLASGRFVVAAGQFFAQEERPAVQAPTASSGPRADDSYRLNLLIETPTVRDDREDSANDERCGNASDIEITA